MKSLPDDLKCEAPLWRIVLSGAATWTELKTTWSFLDVHAALAMLEFKSEIENIMMPKIESKL